MKRALLIVMAALLVCAGLFSAAYQTARCVCPVAMDKEDDLAWLRQEFALSEADLARIRPLHEGYLPKCEEMCEKIAAKKRELEASLADATNLSATATTQLNELASLRAQCQAQMLRHFIEVSQAMPPEQGRRYLAEMQRLTLGFHERIEQSMSDSGGHAHGHH